MCMCMCACVRVCVQSLFQGDVFTVAGWLPPANTMTGIEEVFPSRD